MDQVKGTDHSKCIAGSTEELVNKSILILLHSISPNKFKMGERAKHRN